MKTVIVLLAPRIPIEETVPRAEVGERKEAPIKGIVE